MANPWKCTACPATFEDGPEAFRHVATEHPPWAWVEDTDTGIRYGPEVHANTGGEG